MKVFINLGRGTLEGGCDTVIVQLLDGKNNCLRQFVGSLPPAPELAELYYEWQGNYHCYFQNLALRIDLLEPDGFRYSETEFRWLCQKIPQKLNQWLDCRTFNMIERLLRTELSKKELIQFIFVTESEPLRQLPWHLWNFISDYPSAAVSFSSPNWKEIPKPQKKGGKIRLLAILGNSNGIDVRADLDVLQNLREIEFVILEEPRLSELMIMTLILVGKDLYLKRSSTPIMICPPYKAITLLNKIVLFLPFGIRFKGKKILTAILIMNLEKDTIEDI